MKYLMVVSALLAAACALHYNTNAPIDKELLSKELEDFVALMPSDKISDIFIEYALEDKEFQNLLDYVQGQEFKTIFDILQTTPEVIALFEYLDNAGIPVYDHLQQINDVLGIGKVQRPATYENLVITGGLNGLVDDMRAIVPFDAIEALHYKKVQSSEIYAEFIARITSHEFLGLVRAVHRNNVFNALVVNAKTAGVDVIAVKNLFCVLSGFREC